MKLFIDIKDCIHDGSGIERPQNYYWQKFRESGQYYPMRKIEEDEIHEEIREFLYENENIPNISLDEIPLDAFTTEQLERRDFFISMF